MSRKKMIAKSDLKLYLFSLSPQVPSFFVANFVKMSSQALLRVDDARNSAFDKALHGDSSKGQGGIRAMMSKDKTARAAAVDEYFQHWDNKTAEDETSAVRQSRTDDYASITRQ